VLALCNHLQYEEGAHSIRDAKEFVQTIWISVPDNAVLSE
jgi:hypothetical protein